MIIDIKKSYYAIIPANVRYNTNLTANAKLLYGEITALCNERGFCWASNSYFAELYGVSKETISRWINQLVENKYINRVIDYKEGTCEIVNRYLYLCQEGTYKNVNTPIDENVKENTTVINNTINNTSNKRIKKHTYLEFVKLTNEEYEKLKERLGQHSTDDYIERLNNYIGSKGKRYKSHYHTILAWNRRDISNGQHKGSNSKGNEQEKPQHGTSKSMGEDGYNTTDAADKVIERYGDGIDTSDLEDLPF